MAAAAEAALSKARGSQGFPEIHAHVCQLNLSVGWEGGWRESVNHNSDGARCEEALAQHLAVNRAGVRVTQRRCALVNFVFAHPSGDDFFKAFSCQDWEIALDESRIRCHTMGELDEACSMVREDGQVRLELEVLPHRMESVMRVAESVEYAVIADVLVKGGTCSPPGLSEKMTCLRPAGSGYFNCACCHECYTSDGAGHSEVCNIRFRKVQSPETMERLRVARCLHLHAKAEVSMKMTAQVEIAEPIQTISTATLAAIASTTGCKHVRLLGQIQVVSTRGRFDWGGKRADRVGCDLCKTKAMVRWCWHGHASTRQHLARLRDVTTSSASLVGDQGGKALASTAASSSSGQCPRTGGASASAADIRPKRPVPHPAEAPPAQRARMQSHMGPTADADESEAFKGNVLALAKWVKQHNGRCPQQGQTQAQKRSVEHTLFKWSSNQRSSYKGGSLSAAQIEQLENFPWWSWEPWASKWQQLYNDLEEWLQTRPAYPSRYAASDREKRLGEWVAQQCKLYAASNATLLKEERLLKLLQLPRWSFPPAQSTWTTMFAVLKTWCREHRKLPEDCVHACNGTRWLPIGAWYFQQVDELRASGTPGQRRQFSLWLQSSA